MKRASDTAQLREQIDRTREYSPGEAVAAVQGHAVGEVHRGGRGAHPPRRQRPPRRPAGARHDGRCRTGSAGSVTVVVFAQGDKAREAEAAGADAVGGRGPGRARQRRMDRLRRRDRDART